jgi:hypothetical protein
MVIKHFTYKSTLNTYIILSFQHIWVSLTSIGDISIQCEWCTALPSQLNRKLKSVNYWWIINCKAHGKKSPQANFKNYQRICIKGSSNSTKNFSHDIWCAGLHFNQVPHPIAVQTLWLGTTWLVNLQLLLFFIINVLNHSNNLSSVCI